MSPVNAAQPPRDAAPAVPTLDEVSAQVRSWVDAAAARPVPGPAKMLSDLLQDPKGLDFTLAFVDRVIRPEDPRAAAVELRRLAQDPPAFLPAPLRRVIAMGGAASALAPSVVVPAAQATMRRMVGHLILDARPRPLTSAIQRLTADGTALNINLLGEAVLGAQEAERRFQGVRELVARQDVDYASIKVSSIVDHLPLWAADETVDHIVETLLPLYLEAARGPNPTFLNMDMEEYRDLELTLRVFEKLLDRPELASLHAGTYPAVELFKFISLPIVGILLADSWKKILLIGRSFVFLNYLSMFGLMAWLYIDAPIQICNNYLVAEQKALGWGFAIITAAMVLFTLQYVFIDHSENLPSE